MKSSLEKHVFKPDFRMSAQTHLKLLVFNELDRPFRRMSKLQALNMEAVHIHHFTTQE